MSASGGSQNGEVPPPPKEIVGDDIAKGLSLIQRTADGSTYAFSKLALNEQEFEELGDALQHYEHLRDINLSQNSLVNADKLRSLKYLQVLNVSQNKIKDNQFLSESNQQLCFLSNVDMS